MNNNGRRRWGRLAVLCMLAALLAGYWVYRHQDAFLSEPIPSAGGAALDLPPSPGAAYFLQYDSRWGSDAIGGSGESLSAVGCAVCAVAMACSQLGFDVTPGELNAQLVQASGYTDQGLLIWDCVETATEGHVRIRVARRPSHVDLDKALQAGHVPVVKFYLAGGAPHWVPVVGKTGTEYLVKDSLDAQQRTAPLSEKTATIHSVRYVEKT